MPLDLQNKSKKHLAIWKTC